MVSLPLEYLRCSGALPKAKTVVMDRTAKLVSEMHHKQLKLQEQHTKLLTPQVSHHHCFLPLLYLAAFSLSSGENRG